jgi:uncharacterized membrane protein YdjX (TVP38/TMEM64 family)
MLLILTIYYSGFYRVISFENVKSHLEVIKDYSTNNPVKFFMQFVGAYILITSLSVPGAIVLTLLSGVIYGVLPGTMIVLSAGTVGATISFLYSRYLFKDFFHGKFKSSFRKIDQNFKRSGNRYLFTMRMIPVSPFVVINLMMGLTSIPLWSYVWITFVAMFPGTLLYVYAGRKMADLNSPSEILTLPIILLMTLIAFFPFIVRKLVNYFEHSNENYGHR